MAKLFFALLAALVASASAFAPQKVVKQATSLKAAEIWDPMGLYELGTGESFDTFPSVFPDKQYLQASEIKHGRQAMLAWTGVWATTEVRHCVVSSVGDLCRISCSALRFLASLLYAGRAWSWSSLSWIPG
jgi:Chlorophyll A-B binding protein